jgi:hypothetical protein
LGKPSYSKPYSQERQGQLLAEGKDAKESAEILKKNATLDYSAFKDNDFEEFQR